MSIPFKLELLPRIEIPSSKVDGQKYYNTPEGDFLSVTTIIKNALGTKAIDNWREKVGDKRAGEISTQASNRGNAIHKIAEAFILGNPIPNDPINRLSFNKIKPIIRKNLGTVYGIELPLWSKALKAGGQVDLAAEWCGINSIIDFKTSLRPKREDWIQHYFLQATAYSLMMTERYGMNFPQIALLIMVDNHEPQIFIKRRADFTQKVLDIFTNQR